jgi:predicted GNAT family acetyltransferase
MERAVSDVRVSDHPALERYEVSVDGRRAGLAAYQLEDGLLTFTHTEVDDAYEGQGLGGRLARFALDDARVRGLRVQPLCPFIRGWIKRHPDYADLVVQTF